MPKRTLYIKDNAGHLRQWRCYEVLGGIEIEHGVVNGTMQYKYEEVDGNSVRDQDEQIESRINSRYNKQIDKGYTYDMDKAANSKPMNALGFCKPMLAKKQCDASVDTLLKFPFYMQRKLDGNRCLIHNDGIKLTAYTRNGKQITTIDHILDELDGVIPEGVTLDGELYAHGIPLQTIVSYIKRKQVATASIQYHVYDLITDDVFSKRLERLESILSGFKSKVSSSIKLVETTLIKPEDSSLGVLTNLVKAYRERGYEGGIGRSDYTVYRGVLKKVGYEDGKRSGSLVKFKEWESEEFNIVDIIPSEDGWARLVCEYRIGFATKKVTVSCPGDMNFKYHVMQNKDEYIGKKVTCDFAYWTNDHVPFHPTAVAIRDYE